MNLLEHEAKALLRKSGAPVPASQLVRDSSETTSIPYPLILKIQVPVGGRGKAGGVRRVSNPEGFKRTADELLQVSVKGHVASTLLAEECLTITDEYYLAFIVDRNTQTAALLAHTDGGIDIEQTIIDDPESLKRIIIQSAPDEVTIDELMDYFSFDISLRPQLARLVHSLWDAFIGNDALLLEINPLVCTDKNVLVCADAKMELDNSAAFRHDDWHFEQSIESSQFVILDDLGTVASMANGAGLAMATVDAIEAAGQRAANFLDIGGGTNAEGMTIAFGKIADMPSVRAVVVNVFAGITRCDEVAEAIVNAKKQFKDLPPLYIRLAGTNEQEGTQILRDHGFATLASLRECVEGAAKEVRNA